MNYDTYYTTINNITPLHEVLNFIIIKYIFFSCFSCSKIINNTQEIIIEKDNIMYKVCYDCINTYYLCTHKICNICKKWFPDNILYLITTDILFKKMHKYNTSYFKNICEKCWSDTG